MAEREIMINVRRKALKQSEVEKAYAYEAKEEIGIMRNALNQVRETCKVSGKCIGKSALSKFPFIEVMKNYKLKEYLPSDIVAGLSVGVIHIPQSMGFALLTSLPPVYGLYSTFFPILLYFIFGMCTHQSMGTMALISLMIGSACDNEAERVANQFVATTSAPMTTGSASMTTASGFLNNTSPGPTEEPGEDPRITEVKVTVAVTITLMVGIIQLLMSVLRLGVVTRVMSASFISALTTGAAAHICTSQVPFVFGIKIPKYTAAFQLPLKWIAVFRNLPNTNVASLITALVVIVILVVLKFFVNEKLKNKLPVPIPAELLVVILATLVSYLANFKKNYGVNILGKLPSGLPAPRVPPLAGELGQRYITEAFVVAIVSFVISISLVKTFQRKYRYPIDVNQELLSYGIIHTVSSFFNCFAGAGAPPRCATIDSTRGKTTLHNIISAILLIITIYGIGQLFESLPTSALGALIIVAVWPLFFQVFDLKKFWRVNVFDGLTWLVTLAAVVILDISLGLALGILFSILTLLMQTLCARGLELAPAAEDEDADLFLRAHRYTRINTKQGVKIVRWQSNLIFSNVDRFKDELNRVIGSKRDLTRSDEDDANANTADYEQCAQDSSSESNPPSPQNGKTIDQVPNNAEPNHQKQRKYTIAEEGVFKNMFQKVTGQQLEVATHLVIVDCSAINYIDYMGVTTLLLTVSDYKLSNVTVVLAGCAKHAQMKLDAAQVDVKEEDKILSYPTVVDALKIESA